jgi:DNA-binding IclR family transcriptional regulator
METGSEPGVIKRAFILLRMLASAGRRGVPLSELSERAGFAHATVHRLLAQLVSEGMVVQISHSRRYALGPMAFELGLAAYPHDMREISRPLLEHLAERTQDSVFLSQRSLDESVCVDLQPGPSPIRVVTLEIGTRRPLGVGAGGLAILGALAQPQRDEVVARVGPRLESDWGVSAALLRESLKLFETNGYALIRNRVHAGVSAVGVPVRGGFGQPIAALSIAALNERLRTSAAISTVVAELRIAAARLERHLQRAHSQNRA